MIRRGPALALLAVLLGVAGPARGATIYLAFGDSITEGVGDTATPPGYPERLEKLLRAEGRSASVRNHGLGGETSFQATSRIGQVLAGGGDVLLLMSGTNDIPDVAAGKVSLESVAANLDFMADAAERLRMEAVHATVIPRWPRALTDADNFTTSALVWEILDLAFVTRRRLVDPWQAFYPYDRPDLFETLYSSDPSDLVGHPNAAGYDLLATVFAEVLLGRDTVPPVPGRFRPGFVAEPIDETTEISVVVYEPLDSAGISLRDTVLLVGSVVVAETSADSTRRRAFLTYGGGDAELGCRAIVELQTRDRAGEVNALRRRLGTYEVVGRTLLAGDVDGNCRVDGVDLVQVGRAFGARHDQPGYDILLDFNRDRVIDELDLEELERSFGRESD